MDININAFPEPEGRKPGKSYLADDLEFHHCSGSDVLEICGNALEEISFILCGFGWPHELVDKAVSDLNDASDVGRLIAELGETEEWN
jgi:hypothetical protein